MPDEETSSADPAALMAYSDVGLRIDAELEASATRLAAVLDQFAATCTEYRLGIDGNLANPVRDLARRNREHNLWVRSVAQQFEQADRAAIYDQQDALAREAVRQSQAASDGQSSQPPVSPDFYLGRATDALTEAFKAKVQPLVEQVQIIRVFTVVDQVGSAPETITWTARSVVETTVRDEVSNAGLVAVKDFVASPVEGVPLLGGALQGAIDWVGEPDLSGTQRVGRVVVAGGLATVTAVAVVAAIPEEAVGGGVVIAAGLVANAVVDWQVKPLAFSALGLDPNTDAEQSEPEPAPDAPPFISAQERIRIVDEQDALAREAVRQYQQGASP